MKPVLLGLILCGLALGVRAHGFDERYDLPVPLSHVIAGACASVLLSLVMAIFWIRQPSPGLLQTRVESQDMALPPHVAAGIALIRGLAWLLWVLTLTAALWGSGDPLMNLAPTLVWIVWWVGMSFVVLILGNCWPMLDPWRTTFDVLDVGARKLGLARGLSLGWTWPARLGAWPAVFLLLLWCWLEVVDPIATSPFKLGCTALAWTAFNLLGMVCFGRDSWQRQVDVFALYFSLLGRLAPIKWQTHRPFIAWQGWGRGLISDATMPAAGLMGFVIAMQSTVLFDGLHGGAAWTLFETGLKKIAAPWMDVNGYFAGTVGLGMVWLLFLLAYLATLRLSASLLPSSIRADLKARMAARFVLTLIPIAAAYNVAHNFSSLLIQGQTVMQLLSDPLGRQWDLFGTAKWYPDISIVDARLTWYVAVIAIVLGHVMSVGLAHRLALTMGLSSRRAALVALPLTLLMVAYTAISLTVIAEPMGVYAP